MIYALYAFGAFVTVSFFMCGLFLIAAVKLSSRISREEEERNPAYGEQSETDEEIEARLSVSLAGYLPHAIFELNSEKANV